MKALLELKEIEFKVSHPARTILYKMNYTVNAGDFIVILGSNGSGKSTLLKLLDQRYRPSYGRIALAGKDLQQYNISTLSKKVVTLSQNTQDSLFCSLTVLENCLLAVDRGESSISIGNKEKYFSEYLAQFNPNLARHLYNLAGQLSGGEQQALALGLACLAKPNLLLLDEHTSALDPHAADRLMQLTSQMVKQYGITCILTTHNLELAAQYGNRLLAIQHGKIICDFNEKQKATLSVEELKQKCYEVVAA